MENQQRKKFKIDGSTAVDQMSSSDYHKLENGPNNYFTKKPLSRKYFEILEKRRELPVQKHRKSLLDSVKSNQFTVLVGETGSGKTTQYNK